MASAGIVTMTTGIDMCSVESMQKMIKELTSPSDRPRAQGGHRPHWMVGGGDVIAPQNSYDLVYPGIYIGDECFGKNKDQLTHLGITHIVNSAQGSRFNQINTTQEHFDGTGITFLGIPAQDVGRFKLSPYFATTAEFIDEALTAGGSVAVHCHQGVSRSATLVLAYLMLKKGIGAMEALRMVRVKRAVFPNEGFLKQLCELNAQLYGS